MLRDVFKFRWRRWLWNGAFVLAVALVAASAAGQTYQGGVRGLVRDPQGVIPGAEVTLTNEETSATRTVVSNDVGEYVFSGVQPGVYAVRVGLAGFRPEERKNLRVGTQQTLVQDFTARRRPVVGTDHRHGPGPAGRAQQRHGRRIARPGVAAEPADLRPQCLLCGDLHTGRHPVGRSAVCPLPGSDQRLVPVARRRTAARQRLPDRRRADDRFHQPADHRAVDRSGRGSADPDQDL